VVERGTFRVDRFTARRQEIFRRLVGAEVFDRVIVPRLLRQQTVQLSHKHDRHYDLGVEWDEDGAATVTVYPDFREDVLADPALQSVHPSGAKHRWWLNEYHSAVLLPDYIRRTPATAFIQADFRPGQPPVWNIERTLQHLPAVERLTLEGVQPSKGQTQEWEWERLRIAAPRLRALSLLNVPASWPTVLLPLLTGELVELRELTVDLDYPFSDAYHAVDSQRDRMTFRFPPRTDETAKDGSESEEPLEAVQLRLRLALCLHVLDYLDSTVQQVGMRYWEWPQMQAACTAIERELRAQQQARTAAEGEGGDGNQAAFGSW